MYYLIASPNPTYFATCVAYTNASRSFSTLLRNRRAVLHLVAGRLVVGCQFQGVSGRERGVN